MSREIELCPHCGGKTCTSANNYETPSGRGYIVRHFVECMTCEARTKEHDTEKEAIQSWNTRQQPPRIGMDEKKVEKFIEEYDQLGFHNLPLNFAHELCKRFPHPQVLNEDDLAELLNDMLVEDFHLTIPSAIKDVAKAIVKRFSVSVPTKEDILGAVARGWCTNKNKEKCMDADLAMDITEEVNNLFVYRGKT